MLTGFLPPGFIALGFDGHAGQTVAICVSARARFTCTGFGVSTFRAFARLVAIWHSLAMLHWTEDSRRIFELRYLFSICNILSLSCLHLAAKDAVI
jgi:hypothetical protein